MGSGQPGSGNWCFPSVVSKAASPTHCPACPVQRAPQSPERLFFLRVEWPGVHPG